MLTAMFFNLKNVQILEIGERFGENGEHFSPCYGMETVKGTAGHCYEPYAGPTSNYHGENDTPTFGKQLLATHQLIVCERSQEESSEP